MLLFLHEAQLDIHNAFVEAKVNKLLRESDYLDHLEKKVNVYITYLKKELEFFRDEINEF